MNAPEDPNGLREALARAEAERDALRVIVLADDAKAVAEYEWERANKLVAERDAARETNRELHRRVQAAEGPLLRRAVKAERAATFWLERRRYHGGRAAVATRRLDAAIGQGLAWREEARLAAASLRAAEAEITRLREGMEAAATRFEDIAAGRAFQPRIHAATGATEARAALATLSPKEHPHG